LQGAAKKYAFVFEGLKKRKGRFFLLAGSYTLATDFKIIKSLWLVNKTSTQLF